MGRPRFLIKLNEKILGHKRAIRFGAAHEILIQSEGETTSACVRASQSHQADNECSESSDKEGK